MIRGKIGILKYLLIEKDRGIGMFNKKVKKKGEKDIEMLEFVQ